MLLFGQRERVPKREPTRDTRGPEKGGGRREGATRQQTHSHWRWGRWLHVYCLVAGSQPARGPDHLPAQRVHNQRAVVASAERGGHGKKGGGRRTRGRMGACVSCASSATRWWRGSAQYRLVVGPSATSYSRARSVPCLSPHPGTRQKNALPQQANGRGRGGVHATGENRQQGTPQTGAYT